MSRRELVPARTTRSSPALIWTWTIVACTFIACTAYATRTALVGGPGAVFVLLACAAIGGVLSSAKWGTAAASAGIGWADCLRQTFPDPAKRAAQQWGRLTMGLFVVTCGLMLLLGLMT